MKNYNFYTIGVYGITNEDFFETILSNQIDTFVDIRRRRAVRGSRYSFVNSKQLQNKLKEIGVNYLHILSLAPTNQIRNLQKEIDLNNNIKKRERNTLGDEFISLYKNEILDKFDFENLFLKLETINSQNILFFCVEKEPFACHRSLVTDLLITKYQTKIKHL